MSITRRTFLQAGALALTTLPGTIPSIAAPKYDLLIRGGRVLDPSQRLDRVTDVAIANGKIAALQPNLAIGDASEVIDARNRIVTPGLVDIHCHPRPGELAPERCLITGVTTLVDGGSAGADNIDPLVAVAKGAPNRMRILINISRTGNNAEGELLNFENASVDAARRAIQRYRDLIIGMKVRLSRPYVGERDLDAIRRAHEVTRPLGIPIMIHIGESASPLPKILELLRPGDIVTHVYAPSQGILDANGRVMPQVRDARKRGVLFDIGNGRNGHITWDVAEKAFQQDFLPDTISSDLNGPGLTDRAFDLPTVLSKFLLMGMPLDQVIARATINGVRALPPLKEAGTLKTGAIADVAVFELAEGEFEFVDNEYTKRIGKRKLVPSAVVLKGKRVPLQ